MKTDKKIEEIKKKLVKKLVRNYRKRYEAFNCTNKMAVGFEIERAVKATIQELNTEVQKAVEDGIKDHKNKFETLFGYFEYLTDEFGVEDINGVNVKELLNECYEYLYTRKIENGR